MDYNTQFSNLIPRVRVDHILVKLLDKSSRSEISSYIKKGYIKVNDTVVSKASHIVRHRDIVHININYKALAKPELVGSNIDINIVYEDDDIIVIDKQAGLIVHPGSGNKTNTIVNALIYRGYSLSNCNAEDRLGVVHRLDKDTTGLLVMAKNNPSHSFIADQFKDKRIHRSYIAMVYGLFHQVNDTVTTDIGRDNDNRLKMAVVEEGRGKHAVTHYRVLEHIGPYSIIECNLETGRTHQIRVHMEHIKHSIIGDKLYFSKANTILRKNILDLLPIIDRQYLHAYKLSFVHPKTNEVVEFISPEPQELLNFKVALKERVKALMK